MTTAILTLIIGFALGLGAAFLLKIIHIRNARQIAEELYKESETQRRQQIDQVIESVKNVFGSLSLDALGKSAEQLTELAKEKLETQSQAGSKDLEAKKALIDQVLEKMNAELEKVDRTVKELEKDRVEKFGQLDRQLRVAGQQTTELLRTTQQLKEALASTKARGQWGERMAEDVLRLAGFIENVNYRKQKTLEGSGQRPDYSFILPRNQILNMDVKFPLDNYVKYLEAYSSGNAGSSEEYRKSFLRDVKNRIKEVAGREYINPAENTLDYVLLFIPNEQVYAFIHEQDSSILDEGLKQHVVFCSPITLFAVLAVIRQAMDNFGLESTARQILQLYGEFNKEWRKFTERMDAVGKGLENAQKAFLEMVTTRRRALEKPLDRIEDLRQQKGIAGDTPDEIPPPPEE